MPSIRRRTPARLIALQLCSVALLSAATLLAVGCGSFFSCEGKASCPATGTTGTTGTTGSTGSTGSTTDFAYVANSSTGATYLNGYNLSAGALTAITGSPFQLDYTPSAMVVNPADTFMYTASDSILAAGVGYIYGYAVESTGALSILDSGSPLESESVTSLAISPDGQWLFALDEDAQTLEEYAIDSSTGALTFQTTYGVSGAANGVITPASVRVAPTGDFIMLALGTGGAETYTFDTTTGVATPGEVISPANTATGIYAIAADGNNYIYCAGTAGLQVFAANTSGITPATPQQTYPTGNGPDSIAIDSTSSYVYVGNESDSTITGYAIGTGGVLTALTGSPYTAPTTVNAIAIDNSNAYVIASGYNATSGIQLFSIGSTGTLTSTGTAASGTSTLDPSVIAATH